MRRTVGIVAIVLAAVSCGGGSTAATTGSGGPGATQPPAQSTTVPEGSYGSVREMQKDVEAAFYLCTAPMKVYDPPVAEGALAEADCSSAVELLIYEPNDVQARAAAFQAEATGPFALIVGDNWIITCSKVNVCEKIHGHTGGELISTS